MDKTVITTDRAPAAIGPYSQAVRVGDFLFTAGQIPLNPQTGELVTGDISTQAEQVMENLKAILTAACCTFADVVKTTIFVANMDDFAAINAVYSRYFSTDPPARSTVQAARLPKDAGLEIEMVAWLGKARRI